jgi:hypothetical protein
MEDLSMITGRGLKNLGENNCFLNVVIQALWQLQGSRYKFCQTENHNHNKQPNACVFCALKVIFTHMEFGEDSSIPPTALRQSLSIAFAKDKRFQLGHMNDAAEAFEAVLQCVHGSDTVSNCTCPAHSVFAIDIMDQVACNTCGSVGDASVCSSFVHYVYTAALSQYKRLYSSAALDDILAAFQNQDTKSCPNEKACKAQCKVRRVMTNTPSLLPIAMVWDSTDVTTSDVISVLNCLDPVIELSKLRGGGPKCTYQIKGMVCYHGYHYDAYFYNWITRKWVAFDDERVIPIGDNWRDVLERAKHYRHQPSVVFYERTTPDPLPVVQPIPKKEDPIARSSVVQSIRVASPVSAPSPLSRQAVLTSQRNMMMLMMAIPYPAMMTAPPSSTVPAQQPHAMHPSQQAPRPLPPQFAAPAAMAPTQPMMMVPRLMPSVMPPQNVIMGNGKPMAVPPVMYPVPSSAQTQPQPQPLQTQPRPAATAQHPVFVCAPPFYQVQAARGPMMPMVPMMPMPQARPPQQQPPRK